MKKTSTLLLLSTIAFINLNLSADEVTTVHVTVPKAPQVNVTVPEVELVVDGKKVSRTGGVAPQAAAPQTLKKEESNTSSYEIFKGKRYPPHYHDKKTAQSSSNTKAEVGEVSNARVAAYLQAPLMSVEDAKAKLEAAGFSVISTYKIDKKGKIHSIVFTDKSLLKNASHPQRGFAANLRLLVDEVNGLVSITNPVYVQKAFMQDAYDDAFAKETLKRLRDHFDALKNSKDVVKFIRLPRYKFMNGMPVYEDMIEIASGSNAELLAKARHSKKVVFEQKLSNGSTLIGVDLSRRTKKFVKKIGYQNAELLPYPVLIEDGKAYALAPKYYIAVMYPLLSMSEFMTIATVPGAIGKDLDKIFR